MAIVEFPVELLKLITASLSDKDLCSFVLACSTFHDAVHGDQIVWRDRFLSVYDEPINKTFYDWKATYQKRRSLLKQMKEISFYKGCSKEELEVLAVLWDMLADARGNLRFGDDPVDGRNFSQLLSLRGKSTIFNSHADAHPLLSAVSLFLTPLLDLPDNPSLDGFRETAYNPDLNWIISHDGSPNVRVLNAIAKTLTWHINPRSSSVLFHQRSILTKGEFPGFWEGRMGDEGNIPTKWFGAYTFLRSDRSDGFLVDLTFNKPGAEGAETSTTPIFGCGEDCDLFVVKGVVITPIPSPPGPLSAVSGWKKLEFIKRYRDWEWVYEGIMLPGNNMILGYWRGNKSAPFSRSTSGAFIFWRAPESSSLLSGSNRLSLVRVAG